MGSLEIPNWVGPVVTPLVLILFILIFCFYYCYWKPRRKRNKEGKECGEDEKNTRTYQPCQVHYVDDNYIDYNSSDYTIGMLYTDVCPLPVSNGLAYCRPREYQPEKVFYYPKHPEIPTKSCKRYSNNTDSLVSAKLKKCKVKCAKGQCLKCPDLPIIIEGESFIEEEPEHIGNTRFLLNDKLECNPNVQCPKNALIADKVVVVECQASSDNSNGSSDTTAVGHDSGYED